MFFKMMFAAGFTVAVLFLASLTPIQQCTPHRGTVGALMRDGYGWLSTATTDQNMVVQVFVNRRTAEWAMVTIDDDLNSCLISHGREWLFALERAA